jgi:hypothetical protein
MTARMALQIVPDVTPPASREDPPPCWDAPLVGHPNRSRYALGGLAVAVGMTADDATALAGLLAVPFADAARWIEAAVDTSPERYALRVMYRALGRHRSDCEAAGRRLIAARRDRAEPPLECSDGDAARFVLGSPFHGFGLRYTHAHALAGLFALGTPALLERVGLVPGRRRTLGGRLLPALRDGFADLDRMGRASAFNRGAAAYRARCRRFAEREAVSEDRRWREAPPTRRQRWTILDTAIVLGIEVPAPMTRGEAADWLEATGAILKYRKGGI